jgi:transcriptional regulator with XRE-family HTH domain
MIATAPRQDLVAAQSDVADAPDPAALGFGALLRHYRLESGLSQEALAQRAGLSTLSIGAVERGTRRAPHQATVDALAGALDLGESGRVALEAAVTRSRGPRRLATVVPVPTSAPQTGTTPGFDNGPHRETLRRQRSVTRGNAPAVHSPR